MRKCSRHAGFSVSFRRYSGLMLGMPIPTKASGSHSLRSLTRCFTFMMGPFCNAPAAWERVAVRSTRHRQRTVLFYGSTDILPGLFRGFPQVLDTFQITVGHSPECRCHLA